MISSNANPWEKIKSLLLSDNLYQMLSANDLIEEYHYSKIGKDIIIDHLNTTYKDWHFFLENGKIRKVKPYIRDEK